MEKERGRPLPRKHAKTIDHFKEISRMEALVKMMGTMVDSVTQVVEGEEVKENRRNLQLEQQQDIKGVRSTIRGVLKTLVTDEDNWMVTQAKRKREKEDVYLKHPGLDPVFMKI